MNMPFKTPLSRTVVNLSLFFAVLFALISCRKNNGSKSTEANATVYIAGFRYTPTNQMGTIWKDSVAMAIPNSYNLKSIAVEDTNVYVLGDDSYWKNGVRQPVPDANFTTSIRVSHGDVYVVDQTVASSMLGFGGTAAAIYYKIGAQVNLSQGISNVVGARTTGLAIAGSDVYASAYFSVDRDTISAAYWKNGALNYLPNGYMTVGIAVSGSDVYVAGSSLRDGDVYWKNGSMQTLGPSPAFAKCITASGNDVYVGGTTLGLNRAVYWKNGVEVDLPGGYTVNDMAIVGSDVYAVGNANPGNNGIGDYAVFWKNGVVDTLGIGHANAIAVVSK
jgi:sulfur transfer complex TusBCD TusB component (DsrH family)